jgi:thioredoxin reductase
MYNNKFDVIIIGDSKEGFEAVKAIATAARTIKVAFVSMEFKRRTTRDFLNVEYVKDEVVYIDYKNRLFCCCTKSNANLYSTHLIVASGLSYAPFMLGNRHIPGVLNTIDDIDKTAKNLQAVVIGNGECEIKLAIAAAKKYRYVYLCSDTFELNASTAIKNKLNSIANIAVLPNASISKVIVSDGKLKTVELDNYSSLTCSNIFVLTKTTPETYYIPTKIIGKAPDGCLETSQNSESLLVPRCFAIGNCAKKSTRKMRVAMINMIVNDFIGG